MRDLACLPLTKYSMKRTIVLDLMIRYTVLIERERPLQSSCFSLKSSVPIEEFVKNFPPRSWRGEFRHTLFLIGSHLLQHKTV